MAAEGCKMVLLVRKWACKCRLMPLRLSTEQLLMNLVEEVVTEPGTPTCRLVTHPAALHTHLLMLRITS